MLNRHSVETAMFWYCNLGIPYQHVALLTTEMSAIQLLPDPIFWLLDTISTCLATGDPGNAVTTAFEYDKHLRPTHLVLAMNQAPTEADKGNLWLLCYVKS